ncbi:unnamed protein product [Thlaspi arvense]|uniref:Uncharacterized protein n=1 Tax=Thlaspi arvense TaxID=13288 RepID=A0AAU9SX70_THLAR|nr:unnamed protein product [Thlaspi arvense]
MKQNMSRLRAFSLPDLVPSDSGSITSPTRTTEHQPHEDSGLEGISTNVKLLLKLVQDHNEATSKQRDDWKAQRVNTMMTILDDLKARIQKAQQQSSSGKKELRRCNTELKPRHDLNKNPMKPPQNDPDDEKKGDGDGQGDHKDASLQGRNKELSEQLLKSIDGYRSLKRRYKDVQEENGSIRRTLRDSAEEVNAGTQRLTELREKITREDEMNLQDEISDLEKLFQGFNLKISNHSQKK